MKLNAYAIKKPAIVAGLEDLFNVKNNGAMRLTASPFGGSDNVFLGSAVNWKGKKGKQFETDAPPGVVQGLKNAQRFNDQCRGIKGTGFYGGRKLPNRAICQMKKAAKKA